MQLFGVLVRSYHDGHSTARHSLASAPSAPVAERGDPMCNKCGEPALNTRLANEPEEYHGEEICKERLEGCRERDAQVQTRHCEEREGRQRRKGEESEAGDRNRLVQGAPQRKARAAAVRQSQTFELPFANVEFAFARFEHAQAAQLEVVTRGSPRVCVLLRGGRDPPAMFSNTARCGDHPRRDVRASTGKARFGPRGFGPPKVTTGIRQARRRHGLPSQRAPDPFGSALHANAPRVA